jgi:heterodisulfide reductase subunit C
MVFAILSNGASMRTNISIATLSGEFTTDIESISGQNLLACNQCGKCSSGCPVSEALDLLPSAVLRMAQLGIEDVLDAQTIWYCASCLTCVSRCPKGVDLPRVMEALRTVAMRRGIQPVAVADLSDATIADLPQMAIIGGFRKYSV